MRSARRSTRGRRTPRSRPRGTAAAPRPSDRRTSTIDPGSTHSSRAASASASQTSAAAGWPMTAPPAAVSIAPRHRKTQPRTLRSTSASGGRPRAPRTIRAAPALSATESGQAERLGVARVDHLDGREHRLGGGQYLSDRGRGLDPLPDQERDLGLRARVDELVELQRLAVRHHHARCEPAEDRLVDAQCLPLDPAGQAQLRTDDPLAGLQAVLDHQRLGLVGRVDARGTAACA